MLRLRALPGRYAVCRLAADAAIPRWATEGDFFSVTRGPDELSVICLQMLVPEEKDCERDWVGFYVVGPLDFALTGILETLAVSLAAADIPVLAISSYNTDYVFVNRIYQECAQSVLRDVGCIVS